MPRQAQKRDPEPPDWGKIGMSPKAQLHYAKYLLWIQESCADAESTPLVVLVWGPSPSSGGDLFRIREEIRGRLRMRDDVALFSEELDEACRSFSESSRIRELLQAHGADFVIALYGSPGSIGEVHDMAKALGTKLLIFLDSRHLGGFGPQGLLGELKKHYNNVETFEYPADVESGRLMSTVKKKLKELRAAKWLASKGVKV